MAWNSRQGRPMSGAELFELSDDAALWSRLADAMDSAPGGSGAGLSERARVRIVEYASVPTVATWVAARTMHVTPDAHLWLAAMTYGHALFNTPPSLPQIVDAIEGAVDAYAYGR